jgi:uncharacterized protein YcbX
MSGSVDGRRVGRVVGLWRYPVKSMAGEVLDAVDVHWHGVAGDRRWAFVRDEAADSGFPWMTIRQRADMQHYVPSFVDPAKPDASPTRVRTPSGAELDVMDPALAAELHLDGARVMRDHRGNFDGFPLSLITTATLARLGETVGLELDPLRFRPNLLVETEDAEAFVEDTWVGRTLQVGGMTLRVDKRDGRCVIVTIDPTTLERAPQVLKEVGASRDGCLGVYGSVVTPGRVARGDSVVLQGSP